MFLLGLLNIFSTWCLFTEEFSRDPEYTNTEKVCKETFTSCSKYALHSAKCSILVLRTEATWNSVKMHRQRDTWDSCMCFISRWVLLVEHLERFSCCHMSQDPTFPSPDANGLTTQHLSFGLQNRETALELEICSGNREHCSSLFVLHGCSVYFIREGKEVPSLD